MRKTLRKRRYLYRIRIKKRLEIFVIRVSNPYLYLFIGEGLEERKR